MALDLFEARDAQESTDRLEVRPGQIHPVQMAKQVVPLVLSVGCETVAPPGDGFVRSEHFVID